MHVVPAGRVAHPAVAGAGVDDRLGAALDRALGLGDCGLDLGLDFGRYLVAMLLELALGRVDQTVGVVLGLGIGAAVTFAGYLLRTLAASISGRPRSIATLRAIASASGLRHVLPVHTNSSFMDVRRLR